MQAAGRKIWGYENSVSFNSVKTAVGVGMMLALSDPKNLSLDLDVFLSSGPNRYASNGSDTKSSTPLRMLLPRKKVDFPRNAYYIYIYISV